mmetsp:Transcript_21402/g.60275  ORF Transcript_21402/g.60275 Transcript_21402/m.60275 type:complete len:276 (-) Transcript_21402:1004-1831(-)
MSIGMAVQGATSPSLRTIRESSSTRNRTRASILSPDGLETLAAARSTCTAKGRTRRSQKYWTTPPATLLSFSPHVFGTAGPSAGASLSAASLAWLRRRRSHSWLSSSDSACTAAMLTSTSVVVASARSKACLTGRVSATSGRAPMSSPRPRMASCLSLGWPWWKNQSISAAAWSADLITWECCSSRSAPKHQNWLAVKSRLRWRHSHLAYSLVPASGIPRAPAPERCCSSACWYMREMAMPSRREPVSNLLSVHRRRTAATTTDRNSLVVMIRFK